MPIPEESEIGSLSLQGTGSVRILVSEGLDAKAAADLAALLVDMIRTADRVLRPEPAGKSAPG